MLKSLSPSNVTVGSLITRVDGGSLAEQTGIIAGDRLLSLNGNPINDIIDYWFHNADERLKIVWRSNAAEGETKTKTIRKAYDERLGLEIEPFEIKRCTNYCVFCFVHQLPPKMRRELYVKDEDYRLSFLYGDYITGTNLSPADKERILRYKLSPLYFSVHATDQEVRERLLAKTQIEPIVPLLRSLTKEGIYVHAQVVLCPGINDGAILEKTIHELSALHPMLESIAVVPLGMTNHRQRLPDLQPVTPEYARQFISDCAALQNQTKKRIGYPLVFPSDEFFLIAEMEPPSYGDYPEIPQLANGVGMHYRFYEHVDQLMATLPKHLPQPKRVAAITTSLGVKVLSKLSHRMNAEIENLEIKLLPTRNTLFGEGITVSGLLPGMDFQRMIEENPDYDRYLIPENSLRSWDMRFLDDMLLDDLRASTSAEIIVGGDTAESFAAAAIEMA